MIRNVFAIVAGILVVGVVVTGLQYLTSMLYPLPEGLDPLDPASSGEFAEYVANLPPMAWLLALVSELVGVSLGAFAAGSIASSRKALFAGAIVALGIAGSVMNWMSFPHPVWFIVIQLAAYPLIYFVVTRRIAATDTVTV